MCQTLGSKADGSSAKGSGSDSRKGKCRLMATKVLEDIKKTFRIQYEGFTIERFNLSEGLIFLKAKFEVYNPLSCAIPKWKSIRYSVKIANLKIRDSDREIAYGEVPSKRLRAKEKTTVDVTINASLEHVGDKLKKIILQTIRDDGLLKLELEITFRYPIIGKHTIHREYPIDVSVSHELEKYLEGLGDKLKKNVEQVKKDVIEQVKKGGKQVKKGVKNVIERGKKFFHLG